MGVLFPAKQAHNLVVMETRLKLMGVYELKSMEKRESSLENPDIRRHQPLDNLRSRNLRRRFTKIGEKAKASSRSIRLFKAW